MSSLLLSLGKPLPRGTQVVTLVDRRVPGDGTVRRQGSVGTVARVPVDLAHAYEVRFTDGVTLRYRAKELAVRRREVEGEMPRGTLDVSRHVVYAVVVGSRAFGLATDASDEDVRGVFLPPARLHWSLFKPPEQVEFAEGGRDEVYWELEKYLVLALKANPNVLETLWSPIVTVKTEVGERLRRLRRAFLSRHLYKTYCGYVLSQFEKLTRDVERTGTYKAKHAMHLLRLLMSGIHAVRTGEILVEVGDHREELLRIRAGQVPIAEVKARAVELDGEFRRAFERTKLPEQPDYARVDRFLVWARRSRVR
ncbi:MAG: nucleotidyltransferase domain-containing protein [Planctomycetota bacterium]